jgi:hypothetical protein
MAKRKVKRRATKAKTVRRKTRPARKTARPAMKKATPMKKCSSGGMWYSLLILIVAVLWLLDAWGYISTEVPWLPLIVVLFALGMFWKYKKCM